MRLVMKLVYSLTIIFFTVNAAHAASVEAFLRKFHANPYKEMDRLPDLITNSGDTLPRGYINWDEIRETLPHRIGIRASIINDNHLEGSGVNPPEPDERDLPERLVENGEVERNLAKIETLDLNKASVPVLPWADSYWPMYKGLIGIRYADRKFPNSKDWGVNYQYIQANPAGTIARSGDRAAINVLSPAEKYDIAIGDSSFSLTQYSWNQGGAQYERHGRVASWMGICHGWAGASHMLTPIPNHSVTVISASGIPVVFDPQDIKALESMLWANASPRTRFVGNRCNIPNPPKNANGRILDPKCFDSNPAVWHMAITNQMGIHLRSFVMDSTFDAEVWNFPLVKYQYRYFHPEIWKEGKTLQESIVPIGNFRVDKFKEFRSPLAKYVVGIAMDITHVNAILPMQGRQGTTPLKTVRLVYDLELDENLNMVGGEWYSNAHPDFLWTFSLGSQAMTPYDPKLLADPWSPSTPVPEHWMPVAKSASKRGAPLFVFLRQLTGQP